MRPIIALAAATASAASPSIGAERTGTSANACEVTRILADGREMRSKAASTAAVSTGGGSAKASSSASATGGGQARSSVSVSSSSSSGGGSSRATSSYTDGEGRTVTTTRDERGCTIVIDERH